MSRSDERRRRRPGSGPGRTPRKQAHRERAAAAAAARDEERRRSRLTGRAAVLVLVLAVLAVSFASSLRAYLQQRESITALEATIAERKAAIDQLEDEKRRWQDDAYVAQRARELGYVAVGDEPFIVIGEDGRPLGTASELSDPDSVGGEDEERTWIDDLWDSTRVAGNPPTEIPPPPSQHLKDTESKGSQ